MSRSELIDMLVVRDVLSLTPEAAKARFSRAFELRRTWDNFDGLVIEGGTSGAGLSFSYVPDEQGGYICEVAALECYADTEEQAAELRRAFDKQLRKKLGRPKFYPNYSTPYWKLRGRIELSLSEPREDREVPGRLIVTIQISVPDGP